MDDGDAALLREALRHERPVAGLRVSLHAEERGRPVHGQLGEERCEIDAVEDLVQVALAIFRRERGA